jgi:hypothetical protein
MSAPTREELRAYLEHWKRVGPQLEAIRRQELRNFDFEAHRDQIAGLFHLGVTFGTPRTTTGLVEYTRRLEEIFGARPVPGGS